MSDWRTIVRPEKLAQLIANHREQLPLKGTRRERDFLPVVKLFNPTGGGTWLLSECDEDGLAFGLADLGQPELGYISMEELVEFKGRAGLGIEEDLHWKANKPLSAYASESRRLGYVRA